MTSPNFPLEITRDTIVAPATPTGYSGLAVIRLGGETARNLAVQVFVPAENIISVEAGRAYHGRVVDPATGETIDDAVATFYFGPRSYTGEDLVEISVHGNPLIVERVVNIFITLGARIADRGEFTRRALLNNKLDLIQAEAVLDTINASCDKSRQIAIAQYEGRLSNRILSLQKGVVNLLSIVEADIDFPEEETRLKPDAFAEQVLVIRNEIDELLANADAGVKIRDGYRVAILGRANVGKSTLFNRLLGYDRAIVHEVPGTTRDYLEEGVPIGGYYVRLLDTAGLLPAATGADQLAGDRSRRLAVDADLVILVFDGSEPLNGQDMQLFGLVQEKPRILVVNKTDLNRQLKGSEFLADSLKISAKTGENISLLNARIAETLRPKIVKGDLLLTRTRHIQALKKVRDLINQARIAPHLEMQAYELHAALDLLGELTGRVLRKELLDKIFDEFCIGK